MTSIKQIIFSHVNIWIVLWLEEQHGYLLYGDGSTPILKETKFWEYKGWIWKAHENWNLKNILPWDLTKTPPKSDQNFARMSTESPIIREETNIKINDDLPFRLQTKEHLTEHHFFSQTSLSLWYATHLFTFSWSFNFVKFTREPSFQARSCLVVLNFKPIHEQVFGSLSVKDLTNWFSDSLWMDTRWELRL